MSGKVYRRKDTGAWYVQWYDKKTQKIYKVYRYRGEKIWKKKTAVKLLSQMQAAVENGTFVIEKYTRKGWTDVLPFIDDWLKVHANKLAPATYKGYKSYVKNHIKPYFKRNPQLMLHDIQLDVLSNFMDELPLQPKGKHNVMYCLHVIMDYAKRARRIIGMPSFPKKSTYQLKEPIIKWLPEVRQMHVLEQIPKEHQPIFYFLKYQLRRPAEACALQKVDYNDGVFTICRSISARKIIMKTKTGEIHTIPCHPDFEPFILTEKNKQILTPFFFANPKARKDGKRYTNESLNILWKAACEKAGENINMYSGLKHSSCSQYINEKGLHESELQIITDHANIKSVRKYAKTEVKRKKELMIKNVFQIDSKKQHEK